MADTIGELYEKYTSSVEQAVEDDRYFQYLFEMVQAGDNTLEQKNRILHKVVDERWLTVIEDGIEAIFNIVDKPRRFIKSSEEVVPVALARKITADSVRHLSQNTQFIGTNAAGEIQPTHVLNVTTEESYDLYENRFVYHLIQRLFAFVDKRTDVIFWSTGDETCNVMSMETKVDDAYEEISYRVEMSIKNRQSTVENDTDHMDVFKRIDRVRRLARVLRTSSFCEIMNGCSKVRSPIQRTNLMMKDPDYRTCYKLWQFMESYDEIGYTIEEQDTALAFDEEYQLQMYMNFISNYTVFKSLLESDPRAMTELATEKREPVKPKFIKEIKEEIVEDRNLPDVEVRRVFVEEVTEAQLAAEEKLAEETARREELEASLSALRNQLTSLQGQLEYQEGVSAQAEAERAELEQMLEAERTDAAEKQEAAKRKLEEMEEAMKRADLEARQSIAAARDEAKKVMEQAASEIEITKKTAAEEITGAMAEAEKAKKEAEEAVSKAQAEAEQARTEAEAKVRTTEQNAAEQIRAAKSEAEAKVQTAEQNAAAQIETAKSEAEAKVQAAEQNAAEQIETAKSEAEAKVQAAEQNAVAQIKTARSEAEAKVQAAEQNAAAQVAAAQSEAQEARDEADSTRKEAARMVQQAEKQAAQAEKEKEKAIAKAEANSLSKYLITRLKERRDRKNDQEEES